MRRNELSEAQCKRIISAYLSGTKQTVILIQLDIPTSTVPDDIKLYVDDPKGIAKALEQDDMISKHFNIDYIEEGLLSLNEVLSCIPPPVDYPPDTSTSIDSTRVGGIWPSRITRWEEILTAVNQHNFDEIKRFERPHFNEDLKIVVETNVYTAMETNMFTVLNKVMEKYLFWKQKDSDFPRDDPNIGPFIPDYTCRLINNGIHGRQILALEIKRQIIVEGLVQISNEDLEEENFSGHLHNVIRQIYNYLSSSQLQYGTLSSYDYHWFMYRPKNNHTELHISHALQRDSTSPSVFKAYAYLAQLAERDPTSPHHNIINRGRRQNLPLQSSENIQIPRSIGSSHSGSNVSSMFSGNRETRQQDNDETTEQDFDFSEFKFKSFLGHGQTGGTYRCEFYRQTIALKALDLYKNGQCFYQMQKEIETYKRLSKIQGKYIPKLVCYGYYGGGMGYVMGTTIVGTMLSFHKIKQQQKSKALKALKIIHSHNILHNDIRKENILVNEKENKHISSHSSSQETSPSPVVRKIPYNQKVEQVADGEGQDLAQLFSDAEDAEGKR
ncbi:19215_t:CDS:2 [Funneliformis geosporum]|uniref:19215_t:CDS:1 n=1 Tax=Funneliformis geosporum TaxID=1117311 RepID=A0A9W4WNC6_9GLOM|nr:19215_t:CDS:2 [Funneliformis geosporum]